VVRAMAAIVRKEMFMVGLLSKLVCNESYCSE